VAFAESVEELQAVHACHVVVADDAVDALLVESLERVCRPRLGRHVEAVVLPFEELRRQVGEVGFVVDVEDANHRSHRGCAVLITKQYSVSGSRGPCARTPPRRRTVGQTE